MKILYGVQGTGNGHITRARTMAAELSKSGAQVDYIFSGRAKEDYFDMEIFGDYQTREGLSFVARNGKLDLLATCRQAKFLQLYKDIKQLNVSGYDLVITDFEPIVAWAARRQGVPCIGFGHQYAFQYDIPRYKGNKIAQWILANFAPTTSQLGAHWHHFNHPILPPIMQVDDDSNRPGNDQVLVYLPFEDSDTVMEWLERVPDYHFRMHCKDIEPGCYGNVEVFPFSRDEFHKNLGACASVLCNAGFELNSEALQLGRRILVKPLKGQIEQHSNAMALELLGLAEASETLSCGVISDWLENSRVVKVSYPNVAKALVEWLQSDDSSTLSDLCAYLWQQTSSANGIDFRYPVEKPFSYSQTASSQRISAQGS